MENDRQDFTKQTQEFKNQGKKFLGRYQLVQKIGEGGMGQVFKAFDTSLDRVVALKILSPGAAKDEQSIQRFVREAKTAGKLRHPNIVTVYSFEQENAMRFLVMDFIEGPSLDKLLKKRLSWEKIVPIMLQMLSAIGHAHEQGLVHRDIKPSNILFDKKGNLFISDFGLAKAVSNETTKISHTGTVLGTPAYMSPEQAEGNPKNPVDERSDLYSIGAVLYEMLTGKTPFEGDSIYIILFKLASEIPVHPCTVNPDAPLTLANICMKALSKKKSERYQNAQEMIEDIRKYQSGAEIGATKSSGPGSEAVKSKAIAKKKSPARKPGGVASPKKSFHATSLLIGFSIALLFVLIFAGVRRNREENILPEANPSEKPKPEHEHRPPDDPERPDRRLHEEARRVWEEIARMEDLEPKIGRLANFIERPEYEIAECYHEAVDYFRKMIIERSEKCPDSLARWEKMVQLAQIYQGSRVWKHIQEVVEHQLEIVGHLVWEHIEAHIREMEEMIHAQKIDPRKTSAMIDFINHNRPIIEHMSHKSPEKREKIAHHQNLFMRLSEMEKAMTLSGPLDHAVKKIEIPPQKVEAEKKTDEKKEAWKSAVERKAQQLIDCIKKKNVEEFVSLCSNDYMAEVYPFNDQEKKHFWTIVPLLFAFVNVLVVEEIELENIHGQEKVFLRVFGGKHRFYFVWENEQWKFDGIEYDQMIYSKNLEFQGRDPKYRGVREVMEEIHKSREVKKELCSHELNGNLLKIVYLYHRLKGLLKERGREKHPFKLYTPIQKVVDIEMVALVYDAPRGKIVMIKEEGQWKFHDLR